MKKEIKITKKVPRKGDDGYKIISVRMKEDTIAKLEELSVRSNRSRNELINLLLEAAVDIVEIEEAQNEPVPKGTGSSFVKIVNSDILAAHPRPPRSRGGGRA